MVVGTEDVFTSADNSLMLAQKIPAAWLVQIRNVRHGLMWQYPDKFNNVVMTSLENSI
jgi:pimeloyl-ACP methyl ester carboxylesterase